MTENTQLAKPTPRYNQFKELIKTDHVQERFQQLLDKRSTEFLASLLSLVGSDDKLLACSPQSIFVAAAKAAILQLPIAKELGYAWIIPYGKEAGFVIGYKGLIQLGIRTNQYEVINAADIYEGEDVQVDRLTGTIKLNGSRIGDEVIGYVSYFKLKNGFEKFLYMSREDIESHAKKYSKSYSFKDSAWQTSFDAMGKKTVLRLLLSKYGLLSITMIDADTAEAAPVLSDDPRLAMPNFDDIPDKVVEGEFKEQDPIPTEQDQEFTPEQVYQMIVDAGLSENIHAAKKVLDYCKTGYDTPEKAVAWFHLYRGWKDMGGTTEQAVKRANAGDVPK